MKGAWNMAGRKAMVLGLICIVLFCTLLMGALIHTLWAGTMAFDNKAPGVSPSSKEGDLHSMNALPASFMANEGQISDRTVRFALRGKNTMIHLTDDGLLFYMSGGKAACGKEQPQNRCNDTAFKMTFSGAQKTTAQGKEPLPGKINYLTGQDKSKWHTSISTYAQIEYKGIYPGIDMAVWGSRTKLKYEFHIGPGANPEVIRINYTGIESLTLDEKQNLHIKTSAGEVIDYAPVAYQIINGIRVDVPTSYNILDKSSYGFSVKSNYDKSLPLVIDPDLRWSTFIGGNGIWGQRDEGYGIALDSSGNVYITGTTYDSNFPTCPNDVINPNYTGSGLGEVFVSKFSNNGSTLIYSTFINGGPLSCDDSYAIAVDNSGNAYITGKIRYGLATTAGAYNSDPNNNGDGFVAKISTDGKELLYASYLEVAQGTSIAVDSNNFVYITGLAEPSCPVRGGGKDCNGANDAFVMKMRFDGNESNDLIYSTCLGGSDLNLFCGDGGSGISVLNGAIYVVGSTWSSDFPTTAGAYDPNYNGGQDVFVAKFEPNNSDPNVKYNLAYSTFLGGDAADSGRAIAVDSSGAIYVTGFTYKGEDSNFPTTPGAYDTTHNGGSDAFAAKLEPNGTGYNLAYSTFIGGSTPSYYDVGGCGIKVLNGRAYVAGFTDSNDFPTSLAYDSSFNGGETDAFVCILSPDGNKLLYSTFIGGSGWDAATGIAVDPNGDVFVVGDTDSNNFPIEGDANDQTYNGGGSDVFVFRMRTDCFPSDNNSYNDWVTMGKPDCWCASPYGNGYQCDGDADNATETLLKYRIYNNDYWKLMSNWRKKITDPTLDACADIDHKDETALKYRVYNNDYWKMMSNWRKKDSQLPGNCPRSE